MARPLKLAMVQMRVEGGQKSSNLDRAARMIPEAAGKGAQVILLPEAMNLGWTHPSAEDEAEQIPAGDTCRMLSELARKHDLHVCAGLIERSGSRIFNAAVLIDPVGEIIIHHRKLNELAIGHSLYGQGDRLSVAETRYGKVGLMICADAFADRQMVSRTLGLMGAQLILSPCAWAVPSGHDNEKEPYGKLWRDNYGPVAREFGLWIAGCSNVGVLSEGPWKGRKCIGCSLLIGPNGERVQSGPYGEAAECILYSDIIPARAIRVN